MPEDAKATFTHTVSQHLPDDLSNEFLSLLQSSETESTLEDVLRFIHGAETSASGQPWEDRAKQEGARKALDALLKPADLKRRRETDDASSSSKRPKLGGDIEDDGAPLYTLHAVSTTSPVRKKVDIVVTASNLKFLNHSSKAVEAVVSLAELTRAFVLPTRGKTKPHWTVVILSTDKQDKASPSPQVIFGLDASVTAPFSFATGTAEKTVVKKGDATLPYIHTLLSHLQLPNPAYETDTTVFKSAASKEPCAGTEAYLGAKVGSLWLLKDGILWGESKPCEFWAADVLLDMRITSLTGRQCSVTLVRRVDGDDRYEEGEGEETAFTFLDGREQDGLAQWLRKYRRIKAPVQVGPVVKGPMTIMSLAEESDEEDEDFEEGNDAEGEEGDSVSGSGSGSGEDDDDDEDEDEEGVEDGDGEGEGGGGGVDASGDEDGDEEEELKPENHPLMRPGAMPKMSKAAMNMVVDMMEDQLMGDDEVDELDD